jgi:hypothetical protein
VDQEFTELILRGLAREEAGEECSGPLRHLTEFRRSPRVVRTACDSGPRARGRRGPVVVVATGGWIFGSSMVAMAGVLPTRSGLAHTNARSDPDPMSAPSPTADGFQNPVAREGTKPREREVSDVWRQPMTNRSDERRPRQVRAAPVTMQQAMAVGKWDLVLWLESRARAAERERRRPDGRRRS